MKADNKTVAVTLYFFTDHLPKKVGKEDKFTPTWSKGSIHLSANKTLGIKSGKWIFNSMETITPAIKRVLKKSNIALVSENYS